MIRRFVYVQFEFEVLCSELFVFLIAGSMVIEIWQFVFVIGFSLVASCWRIELQSLVVGGISFIGSIIGLYQS